MHDELSSDDFTPFICQSRVVKRFEPVLAPPSSPVHVPEERYGPEFWERLMREPSVRISGVPGMKSSYQALRTDCDYSSLPVPSLELLPSPSELCRSKKKKKKSESGYDRRGESVQNYIQELKRKQSSIDRLKAMKWGGSSTSDFEVKEETSEMVTRPDPCCEESFADYFDRCQTERQESSFLDFSPPKSTSGVVFPWMTLGADDSFSFMDNKVEEWSGAGNSFF